MRGHEIRWDRAAGRVHHAEFEKHSDAWIDFPKRPALDVQNFKTSHDGPPVICAPRFALSASSPSFCPVAIMRGSFELHLKRCTESIVNGRAGKFERCNPLTARTRENAAGTF